jgi:hypothetical protein
MVHKGRKLTLKEEIEKGYTGEYDPKIWKSKQDIIDAINDTFSIPDPEYNKELKKMSKKDLLWELAVMRDDRKQMKKWHII